MEGERRRDVTTPAPAVVPVDHRDPGVAEEIHALQQASYAVERDLVGAVDFHPLRLTAEDIRREPDTFLGAREGGRLVGAVSFTESEALVDVGRLIVHPTHFRRGIASLLLEAVERHAGPGRRLTVSTAALNEPAVRLYQKHGYHIVERTVLPDGLALVRLAKDADA